MGWGIEKTKIIIFNKVKRIINIFYNKIEKERLKDVDEIIKDVEKDIMETKVKIAMMISAQSNINLNDEDPIHTLYSNYSDLWDYLLDKHKTLIGLQLYKQTEDDEYIFNLDIN
jgi:hypothetical protein